MTSWPLPGEGVEDLSTTQSSGVDLTNCLCVGSGCEGYHSVSFPI